MFYALNKKQAGYPTAKIPGKECELCHHTVSLSRILRR